MKKALVLVLVALMAVTSVFANGANESEGVGELFTLPQLYINENKFDLDVSFSGKSMSTVELAAYSSRLIEENLKAVPA